MADTEPPSTPTRPNGSKRPADPPHETPADKRQAGAASATAPPADTNCVYLNCPFAEKDEAKELGARFDGQRWYVPDGTDPAPFAKWLPSSRVYLNCPFAEKDEAKELGARYDGEAKRWYVPFATDPAPFAKWLASSRVYLKCPFADKDEAKELGAKWDNEKRMWFVPNGINLAPFAKWRADAV